MKRFTVLFFSALCAAIMNIPVAAQTLTNEVLLNGVSMLDTPYVGGVLDRENTEELVLNTDELDCTTFVETVLALTLTTRHDISSYEGEQHQR